MEKRGLYIQLFSFRRDDYWRFSSWHFCFWVNAKSCLFVFTVFPITLFGWALRKKALFLSVHKVLCSQFTSVLIAAELHGAFSSCLILILSTVVLLEKFTAKKKPKLFLIEEWCEMWSWQITLKMCLYKCFGKHLWQFLAPFSVFRYSIFRYQGVFHLSVRSMIIYILRNSVLLL